MATMWADAAHIDFCALRLGRLNALGQVPAGLYNSYVTSTLGMLDIQPVLEGGLDARIKDACGGMPYALRERDILVRYELTLELLTYNPEVEELLNNASLIVAPANYGQRTVTDGVITNTSNVFTSASSSFTVADVGASLTGTGIPIGTTIAALIPGVSTQVQMTQNATATASAVSVVIARALPANFSGALSAPSFVSLVTSTTGGTLAAGNFFYKVTALNAGGETTPSNELTVTTTGATSSNTLVWGAVSGATGYNIYRSATTGSELLRATLGAVTTYVDIAPGSPSGALPVTNTTTTPQTLGAYSPQLGVAQADYGVSLEAWAKALEGGAQAKTLPWFRNGVFQTFWMPTGNSLGATQKNTIYKGFCTENTGFGTGPGRDWLGGQTGVTPSRAIGRYRDTGLPTIQNAGYTPVLGAIT